MRPITEIPASELRALKGVAFDIDDTVTHGGRLTREAFSSMWELFDAGLWLIAITGRPLGWVDVVARHWPVAGAAGENGAGWVWFDGTRTQRGYFHTEAERNAQRFVLERITARVRAELPEVTDAPDAHHRRCDVAFDVAEEVTLPPEVVDQLCKIIESEGVRVNVSSVHAHAIAGDWNKAAGIFRCVEEVLKTPCKLSEWAFIGDSGNDAEAFERFPISVGVANLRENLSRIKTPPNYITTEERGRGFREFCDLLLAARR